MRKLLLLVLLFSLFSALLQNTLYNIALEIRFDREGIENEEFRENFYCEEMRENRENLSDVCSSFLSAVERDICYFPIPLSAVDESLGISYVDSWMGERNYKGKGVHEGTDIMADRNERGLYPVVSISDGTVTNLGWLEKGGYRIGITSPSGVYFYYAHLESYAEIEKGDRVIAGQLLGFMGDSGYGEEGTVGQFPVHLHLGIYSFKEGKEISVNPYYVLLALEDKKLKYYYI
ncbi:MAG: M23 family metallopeptidase [Eubacteriales bacterium]|nr:M23 family metallopeptidase [Eubacteriales bacterium]